MKKIFVGSLILVMCGLVFWSFVARHRQQQRYFSSSRSHVASFSDYQSRQSEEWKTHERLFDKNKSSAAAIFAGATKVEIFRLFTTTGAKPLGKVKGFSYFANGTYQVQPFATRLGTVILDAKTYSRPGQSTKLCYFEPGIDFRIWKNAEFIDTIICFNCNQLAVLENNSKVPERNLGGSLQGRFYVAGDFDSARAQLVALAKEAFPNDGQVQSLD